MMALSQASHLKLDLKQKRQNGKSELCLGSLKYKNNLQANFNIFLGALQRKFIFF